MRHEAAARAFVVYMLLELLSTVNWFHPCGTNAPQWSTFEAIFHLCFGASDGVWWKSTREITKLILMRVMRISCVLNAMEHQMACMKCIWISFFLIEKQNCLTFFQFVSCQTINSISQCIKYTQSSQPTHDSFEKQADDMDDTSMKKKKKQNANGTLRTPNYSAQSKKDLLGESVSVSRAFWFVNWNYVQSHLHWRILICREREKKRNQRISNMVRYQNSSK